jgi:acetoin:2,6-dichlorophenolindophenol oxidoreductase subunit alpha
MSDPSIPRDHRRERLWMYATMVKSRYFEARVKSAYFEGKQPVFNMADGPIPGEMHLSDGQEPCAVGLCVHLDAHDIVMATHRPHHVAIAKRVDLEAMTSEIFGKKSGLSGGKGGHMHLFDARVNFACSGIIAQGLGPAVGAALSARLQGRNSVAVAYLGEGGVNQGAFHEAMNLASVWKAPVIFVIEDNGYGISVAKSTSTSVGRAAERAAAYGMPGHHVADNDPDVIYAVAGEAIRRARSGGGPSLIDIATIRLEGHFIGDAEGYRPAGEKHRLQAADPLPRYRAVLLSDGFSAAELESAEANARAEVDRAFTQARAADAPHPEEAFEHVFA